jgi:hypothetical protein
MMSPAASLLCLTAAISYWQVAAAWKTVSVVDFGAKGDNATDNTAAFHAALLAVEKSGGGEVLVPAWQYEENDDIRVYQVFQTAPINLTSNVVLRVEGHMRAVQDKSKVRSQNYTPDSTRLSHLTVWGLCVEVPDRRHPSVGGPRLRHERPHTLPPLRLRGQR